MGSMWEQELAALLGEDRLLLDEKSRTKLSKDYYWYSPVLVRLLQDKVADGAVVPKSEAELAAVLAYAYDKQIPVTPRGGGTGNYGQAVPLDGGLVLDLSALDQIVEIGEGSVRVQCGVRLGNLDKALREVGQDLCIYPSTFVKSTAAGFVCGGSGGIGSITWGSLWDGNVQHAVVYTMEGTPQRLEIEGEALTNYIHNYGTSGIVVELTLRTTPRTQWEQFIVQFADLDGALTFSHQLSSDAHIYKRLVSVAEWPVPSFFKPFRKYMEDGSSVVLLEIAFEDREAVEKLAAKYEGRIVHTIAPEYYHQKMGVSDFTWNHTTLWALKNDPTLTYLQAGFDLSTYPEQIDRIRERYPDEVLHHFEWMHQGVGENRGLRLSALPIVRYTTEERLYEIIGFLHEIGVSVRDPHSFVIGKGSKRNAYYEGMLKQKLHNDPKGLLNPGKFYLGQTV